MVFYKERLVAASKKVLLGMAAKMVKNRLSQRPPSSQSKEKKLRTSDLVLTKTEFTDLMNLFRLPGQARLETKDVSDIFTTCT